MNEQMALDPTLTQILNELVRSHALIQRLQARIVELEQQPPNGTWTPTVQTTTSGALTQQP